MLNQLKKLNRKSATPLSTAVSLPFKKTCPYTILPPPFFNFSGYSPPSRGGNQNLLPPTLKRKGGPKTKLCLLNFSFTVL